MLLVLFDCSVIPSAPVKGDVVIKDALTATPPDTVSVPEGGITVFVVTLSSIIP